MPRLLKMKTMSDEKEHFALSFKAQIALSFGAHEEISKTFNQMNPRKE